MLPSLAGLSDDVAALLTKLPYPSWHASSDGKRDFFNPAWLKFTGRTFEEEISMGWLKGVHPEDREKYVSEYNSHISKGLPYELEFRIRHADGGYRWVVEDAFPLYSASEGDAGYIGSLRDITALRRYQDELKNLVARERFLRDMIPDALVTIDLSGNVLSWNAGAERIFGYELFEAIGRSFKRFIPERHHPLYSQRLKEIEDALSKSDRVTGSLQAKAIRRDGSEAYLSISYVATKGEDGVQITLLAKDVSSEKIAMRSSKRELERLKTIIDNSSVGVALIGLDGKIAYANRAFSELLDYTQEQLGSISLFDIVYPEDRDLLREDISAITSSNVMHVRSERRFVKSSGRVLWAAVTLDVYKGEDGRPIYGILELVDITDIKRMEQELSDQIRELRMEIEKKSRELESARQVTPEAEKLISIGMSLAQVTHDIRNPLTAIDLGLYALENSIPEKDRDTEKIISTMRNALKQANDIVTELTQFVKPTVPKKMKLSFTDVVNEAVRTINIPSRIKLQLNLQNDAYVLGDPAQLSRVVQNLVKNAVEAMQDGGILKISTEIKGEKVVLSVSDTGKGIPKETMEKLFSPFFTTKEKGLGLGLTIVKKYVTDHGGQVEVDSEEGKGTTFRVILPAQPA